MTCTSPITLTSYIRRQSSVSASATGLAPNAPPALLTSTSSAGPTRLGEGGDVGLGGHVAGDRRTPDLGGQRLDPVGAPRGAVDVEPGRGQAPGGRGADAAAGSGDDGGAEGAGGRGASFVQSGRACVRGWHTALLMSLRSVATAFGLVGGLCWVVRAFDRARGAGVGRVRPARYRRGRGWRGAGEQQRAAAAAVRRGGVPAAGLVGPGAAPRRGPGPDRRRRLRRRGGGHGRGGVRPAPGAWSAHWEPLRSHAGNH